MNRTVVGLFDDRDCADKAVDDLLAEGIAREHISVVTNSGEGGVQVVTPGEEENLAAEGAATGLTTGAVVGGIVGLLAGAGAVVVPLGLAVAGPLAGLLAGSAAGAATGGILGGLIGLGIPEDHAQAYFDSVRHGSILVSVQAAEEEVEQVERILDRDGAVNVHDRSAAIREIRPDATVSERMTEDEWAKVREQRASEERSRITSYVRPESPSPDRNIPVGRREVNSEEDTKAYEEIFQPDFSSQEATPEGEEPYQFGFESAKSSRFQGHDWSAVEDQLRDDWEQRNPGTWDECREAVQNGWNRCHLRQTSGGAELL